MECRRPVLVHFSQQHRAVVLLGQMLGRNGHDSMEEEIVMADSTQVHPERIARTIAAQRYHAEFLIVFMREKIQLELARLTRAYLHIRRT